MITGDEISFPMNLHISKDQFLDLYYLTDASTSMKDDLQNLGTIGTDIVDKMMKITDE